MCVVWWVIVGNQGVLVKIGASISFGDVGELLLMLNGI
jgi:hypothetical protein